MLFSDRERPRRWPTRAPTTCSRARSTQRCHPPWQHRGGRSGRAKDWYEIGTKRPPNDEGHLEVAFALSRPVCRDFASPTPWSASIAGAGFSRTELWARPTEIVPQLFPTESAIRACAATKPPISRHLLRVSDGTRTRGRLDHNQELYQLSYAHHAIRVGSLAPSQPLLGDGAARLCSASASV